MRTPPHAAKLVFLGASILVLAFFVRSHGEVTKLTAANQILVNASQEVESLAHENQEIARLRPLGDEAEKLREGIRDLPKLRDEVRTLRERFKELKTMRAKNDQLLAQRNANGNQAFSMARPEGFLPKAELFDAGLSNPESTVQTYFWAMSRGNVSRFYECIYDKRNDRETKIPSTRVTLEKAEKTRKQILKEMETFPGYRIAEKKTISADRVEVALQSTVGGVVMNMTLARIGSEWKIRQ